MAGTAMQAFLTCTSCTGQVVRVRGREELSRAYRYVVEAELDEVVPDRAPNSAAYVHVSDGRTERHVHGIVETMELEGQHQDRVLRARLVLRPLHYQLAYRHGFKIYQEQSVPDIVAQVFTDAGIPESTLRWDTRGTYETREYTTQYDESEWDFVCRLLEDEGIWFAFEHDADAAVMVFGDASDQVEPVEPDEPADPRQVERVRPLLVHVEDLDPLAAAQGLRRDLILGRVLVEPLVEVERQQRHALLHPFVVVRAAVQAPRQPGALDRAEARRSGARPEVADRVDGILDVRPGGALELRGVAHDADAVRVPRLLDRVLRIGLVVRAAPRALPHDGHRLEGHRIGERQRPALPIPGAVTEHAQTLAHRADTEAHVERRHRLAIRSDRVAADHHVRARLGHAQIGRVLDRARLRLVGEPPVVGDPDLGAVGGRHEPEARRLVALLDEHDPDVRPVDRVKRRDDLDDGLRARLERGRIHRRATSSCRSRGCP